MGRVCKVIGTTLSVVGVLVALLLVVAMLRDEKYQRAVAAAARNPGNVMYESELAIRGAYRGLELVGVIVGVLVTINGATLLGLGVLAERVPRRPVKSPD